MANQDFNPPPPMTLMEAFVVEPAATPSDGFTGDADQHRGVLLAGKIVFLCGYSSGIKYGGCNEDQYDEADEDDALKRGVMSKGDRMRKVRKRAFSKRGSIHCKRALDF